MHYNKVVICGINTADIKVLTKTEKQELMRRIKEGDKQAQNEFINGNLRLVLSVVKRFSDRGEEADDLFQVGCIGLIKAINNFDMEQGVQFSTYAVPMIMGELRRYLRDNNIIRVSRSMRDLAYKALSEKERLSKKLGREATVEEVAKELQTPVSEVVGALDAIMDPVSLFEPIYSENGDPVCVMDQLSDNGAEDNNWLDEISIREAFNSLNEREKKVVRKRFFDGLTQVEVADDMGISQAQVSRLEKSALKHIKSEL